MQESNTCRQLLYHRPITVGQLTPLDVEKPRVIAAQYKGSGMQGGNIESKFKNDRVISMVIL